jgi:hypothetical protein
MKTRSVFQFIFGTDNYKEYKMAGKISAKNAAIFIDSAGGALQNVSADCNSFEIEQNAGAIEVTGFSEGSKNYIPGLPVNGITFNFLYNTSATSGATTILRGIFNSSTSKTVTVVPEIGASSFSGEFMLDSLTVKGTPDGPLELGTAHFSAMGGDAATWT